MIPEVHSTLCMHVKANSSSKRALKDIHKGVLLFHSIFEKVYKATIAYFPALRTINGVLNDFSKETYLGFFWRKTGLGGLRWIKAPIMSPGAKDINKK